MIKHAAGNENNELTASAATVLRTKRYWTAAAAIVYLAILIARVWGAHRFLHFEESAMVGASRSLPLSAIWDDHAYGKFLQWVLVEVSTLIDISFLPSVLVALAVFVCSSAKDWRLWHRALERMCVAAIAAAKD